MIKRGQHDDEGHSAFRPFRVVVPNRVDIAGGTLDIYPLYLLIGDAMTVNAAVAVRSEVAVRPFRRGAARLSSGNFGIAVTAVDTHGFSSGGKMGLLSRALRHFPAVSGVDFLVCNEAPVGSGLGASSALLVALMLAAGRVTGTACRRDETARAAMEIEAAHLKSLTGRQDHLAALRGGLQGIRFSPGRVDARRLPPGGPAGTMLRDHAFLAHTGIAHHSSDVNWRMIRGAIDGDGDGAAEVPGDRRGGAGRMGGGVRGGSARARAPRSPRSGRSARPSPPACPRRESRNSFPTAGSGAW